MDSLTPALSILEKLLQADPVACQELLMKQVEIDSASLKNLPIFTRAGKNSKSQVSVLGLLNGILTQLNGETERIALIVDQGDCVGFHRLTTTKK